jgi:hypothetical protein
LREKRVRERGRERERVRELDWMARIEEDYEGET